VSRCQPRGVSVAVGVFVGVLVAVEVLVDVEVVVGVAVCRGDCDPVVMVWLPPAQLSTPLSHVSCQISTASSVSGFGSLASVV
jgi:hypothetical protein